MKSTEIFDFMRPKGLTNEQVTALYALLKQGAQIETIAEFIGYKPETKIETPNPKLEEPLKPKFTFSNTSLARLATCHPDIQKVIRKTMEITGMDFIVLEGERTKEQAYINWGKGRTVAELAAKGVPAKYAQPKLKKVTQVSTPLASKHVKQKDGYAHAVDIAPYPIDWENITEFEKLIGIVKKAAALVNVKLAYGTDWKMKDYPHIELP